ncbi:MAG TPA: BlaI/MecI/CopY family transcriptional regulator [Armatimonadota bacterium]|nr:BlaI/MecI/CopY family transcriptional regulator [Armatimonadota bacterium]
MSDSHPTNAELAILQALWRRGPSTVREVCDEMGRSSGYTTVLKILQIMTQKGLVQRDKSDRAHVYQARHSEEQIQRGLVNDLLTKAFRGSSQRLVMRALSAKPVSAEELAAIRKLIDEMEDKAP